MVSPLQRTRTPAPTSLDASAMTATVKATDKALARTGYLQSKLDLNTSQRTHLVEIKKKAEKHWRNYKTLESMEFEGLVQELTCLGWSYSPM